MTPQRARPPYDWGAVLGLIRAEFAYMDGRIDPPSSMHRLSVQDIARQADRAEVWVIGTAPIACMFLTPKNNWLYLGKLAVASSSRGTGLARVMVDTAMARAADLGLQGVELETRVELTFNHATFRALGFVESGRSAHPGFDRPTSLTFRKSL